ARSCAGPRRRGPIDLRTRRRRLHDRSPVQRGRGEPAERSSCAAGSRSRRMNLAATTSDLAGLRVLVIEDEAMVAMLLEDTLADIGCEVVGVAARFEDAVEKAKSLAFDI